MDPEVKFSLDHSFTSNESNSAQDPASCLPSETASISKFSSNQPDSSSISDLIADEGKEILNNDNLQLKLLQSSSLSLEKNQNEETMSLSKEHHDMATTAQNSPKLSNIAGNEKITDTHRSSDSSNSDAHKVKSFKDKDIFTNSHYNLNHNSIAVMNNIDEQKAKHLSLSKKSSKSRKPWYSVFTNTYKQKNEDFHRLFKLPSEEILLADYSCALQREILAHGRLYVSLNYVCFRANIIGWETTVILKLKEVRSILKDKTAKIIPNAISLILDNEKYFLTSFSSRDKTYTNLIKVWQNALSDVSMTSDEVNRILKTCYGEDLGYNSDDIEYEYYSKLRTKQSTDQLDLLEPGENRLIYNPQNSSLIPGNQILINSDDINSFSDDQTSMKKQKNNLFESSSSSSFGIKTPSSGQLGHRHSSSYDASIIDTNESAEVLVPVPNTTGVFLKRPRSMVVEKNTKNHLLLSNTWSAASPVSLSNEISTESSDKSSQSTDVNNNEQKSDPKSQSNFSNFSPIANNSQASKKVDLSSSMIGQTSMVSPSPVTSSPSEPVEVADLNINNNAKCSCTEHNGKELMNLTFNMSVNQLFESLFGHSEFCRKYWESRKFGNLIVGEWNNEPVLPARRLEYTVDLGGALGRPKNTEDQKILEYRSEVCIVMESSSVTHNVPYSDYFVVKNRFCITRITANQTRVIVNCHIFYKKNPNFIIKNFIEKNSISAIKDSFLYIASIVNQFHDEKCHESTFNKIGLENSSNSEICSSDFKEKNLPECKKLPEKTGTISAFKTEKDEISHIDSLDIETRIRTDHKTKPSNKKILKKRHANHTGENRNDQVFEFVVQRSNSENNPIPERSTSNQPQLVPLHKFSFFGIEINVDTIVRLFIVAMVCLMIINGVLYYKLRRIESLADSLKSDPNLLYKSGQFDQALTDLSFEEQNNWQLAIKNTLEAISKMEYSLKQLNKNFESHEPEEL